MIGLAEANRFLEDMQSEFRFKESIDLGEEVYDIYSAKKKNGKPKDGDPNWDMGQKINAADISSNLFTVVFSE